MDKHVHQKNDGDGDVEREPELVASLAETGKGAHDEDEKTGVGYRSGDVDVFGKEVFAQLGCATVAEGLHDEAGGRWWPKK